MASNFPRIVIAGTNSGVGKTSVTLALITALRIRGLNVQAFKVGPDYLDPTYLTTASGKPCYNLDSWMMGREYVRTLFSEKARKADISVIEGVMGLFDGSDPVNNQGSTAEIAELLDAPVILITNVHGVARSIAPLVKGFCDFQPGLTISGVVANKCGSEKHAYWLNESLKAYSLPEIVSAIPRGAFTELPSRHLGLVTANHGNLPQTVLQSLAETFEANSSVDLIIRMADSAGNLECTATVEAPQISAKSCRLAVAKDEAFHFYYQDNLDALEQAGCELIFFSPLHDSRLPEKVNGIYLGGGYPEEHAEALSANIAMIGELRLFAESGKPIYAECGGLMYLSQGIETVAGKRFSMIGLLPWWTGMLPHLKRLGYVEVKLNDDSLFGNKGDVLRGHEFHYSELVADPYKTDEVWDRVYSMTYRRSENGVNEGFRHGKILASYVHAHFAGKPDAVKRFVSHLAE